MLRHVASAAVARLAGARGSGFRAMSGHNSRWRSAFSTATGEDGDETAKDAPEDDVVGDNTDVDGGEGGDDVEAAGEGDEVDAPVADGSEEGEEVAARAHTRFTGDKFDTLELSGEGADGEEIKMKAVRPLWPMDDSLLEKDGWLFDITEQGHTVDWNPNIKNAHLSDRTKTQMYLMHMKDPKTWDVPALAEQYKIRQQRVMAILALKKIQREHETTGKPTFPGLEAAFEEIHGSEDRGTGEKNHYVVPELPKFQVVPANTTPEQLKEILPPYYSAEERARRNERELIRKFRDNLAYNTREAAPSLNREGRIRHPGKRPKGGWGLMVIPMVESNSTKTRARAKREGWRNKPEKPYVAFPDGSRRDVNGDEEVMLRRRKPRPFRKII